jgi:hypothetical protein
LIYKDENWALNGALGGSASYVADKALPARESALGVSIRVRTAEAGFFKV